MTLDLHVERTEVSNENLVRQEMDSQRDNKVVVVLCTKFIKNVFVTRQTRFSRHKSVGLKEHRSLCVDTLTTEVSNPKDCFVIRWIMIFGMSSEPIVTKEESTRFGLF